MFTLFTYKFMVTTDVHDLITQLENDDTIEDVNINSIMMHI